MFIPSFDLSKPLQFYEGAIRYGCTDRIAFVLGKELRKKRQTIKVWL